MLFYVAVLIQFFVLEKAVTSTNSTAFSIESLNVTHNGDDHTNGKLDPAHTLTFKLSDFSIPCL